MKCCKRRGINKKKISWHLTTYLSSLEDNSSNVHYSMIFFFCVQFHWLFKYWVMHSLCSVRTLSFTFWTNQSYKTPKKLNKHYFPKFIQAHEVNSIQDLLCEHSIPFVSMDTWSLNAISLNQMTTVINNINIVY